MTVNELIKRLEKTKRDYDKLDFDKIQVIDRWDEIIEDTSMIFSFNGHEPELQIE